MSRMVDSLSLGKLPKFTSKYEYCTSGYNWLESIFFFFASRGSDGSLKLKKVVGI